MVDDIETLACSPSLFSLEDFNPKANLPYGLKTEHIAEAMQAFSEFLGFINMQLHSKKLVRLECMLMPASFSSLVGEFMAANIPVYCHTLVKNKYHNGHPDLVPADRFPDDAVQHSKEGIEIKGSRYPKGWQGHNPEDCYLMVFVFDSNRQSDAAKGIAPRPFNYRQVLGARLTKEDWNFAGRSATSRRTITASVTDSGYKKMTKNWIYKASGLGPANSGTCSEKTGC